MLKNLLSSNIPTIISSDHIVCKICLRLWESPSTLFKPSNSILFAKDQGLLKHYFFIYPTILKLWVHDFVIFFPAKKNEKKKWPLKEGLWCLVEFKTWFKFDWRPWEIEKNNLVLTCNQQVISISDTVLADLW